VSQTVGGFMPVGYPTSLEDNLCTRTEKIKELNINQ